MKKYRFKSIRSKLTFWFLFLALMPLLVGIVITFNQQKDSIEKETFDKLIAIRDLKVEQLHNWLIERINNMKTISTNNELVALQDMTFKDRKSQDDLKTCKNIRRILNRYLNNYDAYHEIFIINPRTGVIEISTDINSEGMDKSDNSYFTQPLQTRELFIKNIYYSKTLSQNSMSFSIPIFCSHHKQAHVIGILVARINLKNSLYALLQNRTGLGKTGETLIVNKDLFALNELRWHENAPLNLQINAVPAIKASQGQTGIAETTDYRDEKIIAAYTCIPETGWGFVAKQDLYELNAPIRALFKNLAILLIISTILIVLIVFLLSKQISKPIIDMNITAQKFREGNYSIRNIVSSEDELGSLADSINQTSEAFESAITTQKGVSNISETMIGLSSMQEFGSELLDQLMEITKSNMGTFYILNEAISEYEHFASVGANEKLLKSFSSENPEGEFGYAISRKEIFYLRNISEDTVFKFQTTAGDLIPKEIITIPILIDDTVAALISLVNINKFSNETYEIIKQVWTGINTSYSSLMANERTRILAENLYETNQQLEAQAEELQEQSEELKSQSEELRQTAEELQEQNVELEAQRDQVEEANRLKSEFLSNMSHELRTPLNSVMALSRVLLMQAKDKLSEEELNYLEIIERNGKNLLSLINDILDLSKIEAGRMDVYPRLFPVDSTIETILERLEPLAENKGIELIKKVPDDFPQIESDESRVHQILQNLVANAVKFTEKGAVTISARSDDERIYIDVNDTGIGISEKDLPCIFEEFRQVDGTSSRQYEGTGLGLAIAYKAASMLGGNLSVESVLGKGSTFTLTFPIKWPGILPVSEPLVLKTPERITLKEKSILVVDDEPNVASMISDYLSNEGYHTITATSGEKAIRLAKEHKPFAITIDIMMPEMDGWEVLQKLKENPDTKNIPVIIISISDDKETGFALGAVGYITKPVNKDVLIAEIKKILADIGKPHRSSVSRELKTTKRVLVVEDNPTAVMQVRTVLESEGYRVDIAGGGQEALDYIKDTIPDGIILDLMMPGVNGFAVLNNIRADKTAKNIPVLILTAKDLTSEDLKILADNDVQQLVQKGDVPREILLHKTRLMLGETSMIEQQKKAATQEIANRPPLKIAQSEGKSTILVVEDNPDNMITMKAVLHSQYNLIEATDGEQGLNMALAKRPDLILLDMSLPKMDGFTVVREIKGDPKGKHIPVIALTAHAMKGDREKILDAGCDDYISKPVNPEKVLAKVGDWLET